MIRALLLWGLAAPALAEGPLPAPLETPPFEVPDVSVHRLSNGLEVRVVENHEVPVFSARVVVRVGAGSDPAGREGLAAIAADLMDDGAGDLSAEALSRRLKQIGSSLSTRAGSDEASVGVSGLTRNLEPTLDLLALVVKSPALPAAEFEIAQARRVADARAKLDDPSSIATDAFYRVLYQGTYRGATTSPESYGAITLDEIRAWHAAAFRPENAVVFVGGDVDPAAVAAALEARLGAWTGAGEPAAAPIANPFTPAASTLYFIDKPGAAQSVVRVGAFVGRQTDADHFAFDLGNTVLGGAFTARLNMNLREDKGYTYGARCGTFFPHGPGVWYCAANVQTEVTGPSLVEFDKEIRGILTDNPASADELAYFKSSRVNGFPGDYETVDTLLGEEQSIWLYGLPADWIERYLPGVEAVDADAANAALRAHIDPERLVWLVVGDRATVWDDLSVLGLPIVELNRDGTPVQGG